jgi:hypothetical protein
MGRDVHGGIPLLKESRPKRKKAALCGCGLLENLADIICSALSSDTARPIVERATTLGGAEMGPVEYHYAAIHRNGR